MTINLKVLEHIYKKKTFLRIFLYLFSGPLSRFQNNPLSTDPFSLENWRKNGVYNKNDNPKENPNPMLNCK
jgi:hypothetical protein